MNMRSILLIILLCLPLAVAVNGQAGKQPAKPAATPNAYVRPDQKTRFRWYFKSMVGPEALGADAAVAAFSTWRNTPPEWGKTWNGFGKRFASNVGRSVISNTTRFALEEAFKLDSHYYRSTKKDVGSRIKNALIAPFTARNASGKLVLGFPRIAGTYTAHIVSVETWYPKRYGWRDGLRSGSISLGADMLFSLFKEFIHR